MEAKKSNRLNTVSLVGRAVDTFYRELREAPEQGKPVAWADGIPIPFPLLRVMDTTFLYGDAYAALVAARHQEKRLQEIADDHGYIVEVCSYTRSNMGMAQFPEGEKDRAFPIWLIPKPDFIVVTDPGCSMLVNWADAERRLFKVPMFVIQSPHIWEGGEEEEAIAETVKQLKEFITFMEDILHKPFDWDKLRALMADVKKATTLRVEAMKLCQTIPSPATFFDWAAALGGVNYLLGKPECVEVYEAMKQEVEDRIARKEGAVIGETCRLYWDGIMCWPKFGHLANKFADLGACVVAGRYTHLGFYSRPEMIDPQKPLEGLAVNTVMMHPNRNLDWLIDNISRLCQEYRIDGIICHAHRTCRPLAAPQMEIMDGVSRRLGIPAAFFEADMADETFYADAQLDTRVQALVESIAARKRR